MRKAVLCVAVAAAMFVGTAIPKVYAEEYSPSDVKVGETVMHAGDVLKFLEGADQGMLIHYKDTDESTDDLRTVNTKKGEDYTIPDYNSMGINSQLLVGATFEGWKVYAKPEGSDNPPQWNLVRCLGNSGQSEINLTGSYELKADTNYTLNGGLTHVEGDATTYVGGIKFTVSESKQYTFK